MRVRQYGWNCPEPDTSSLAKTLELIVLHFDVMQMGAQAESDHTPSRTRHKYIPVGSNASSLTHTVLEADPLLRTGSCIVAIAAKSPRLPAQEVLGVYLQDHNAPGARYE